jgi:hypothetical protein
MGTAEHQPRVGDKRSSAQPCRQRGDARGSHRHDTHEACKRMRSLSISSRLVVYAFTPESTSHIALSHISHGVLAQQRTVIANVRYGGSTVGSF